MSNPPFEWNWQGAPRRMEIRRIYDELREFLTEQISEPLLGRVLVVASELLANAVEHGCLKLGREEKERLLSEEALEGYISQKEQELGTMEISLRVKGCEGSVLVAVSDPGDGFDLEQSYLGLSSTESIGNRGIRLVRAFTDSLTIHRTEKGETRVEARLRI